GPSFTAHSICVNGVGGEGIYLSGSGQAFTIINSTVVGCGGNGVEISQNGAYANRTLSRCMITGNGGYGVSASNVAGVVVARSRMRDNASGNINGGGNYPSFDNEES